MLFNNRFEIVLKAFSELRALEIVLKILFINDFLKLNRYMVAILFEVLIHVSCVRRRWDRFMSEISFTCVQLPP